MKNLFFNWLILSLLIVINLQAQVFVNIARPDDSGDGFSLATAKKTIAAGIAVALDGQTVSIEGGEYIISSTIVIDKKIRLLGVGFNMGFPLGPEARLTLADPAKTILQVASKKVTIQNLYLLLNGSETALPVLLENSKQAISVANHGANKSYDSLLIHNNYIENINTSFTIDFESYAIRLSQPAGNLVTGDNYVSIRNNRILSNFGNGIFGRGIRSVGNFGQIRNNDLIAFYGIQMTQLFGGNMLVKKNRFNGIGDAGIEINSPFQPNGVHDIDSNTLQSIAGTNPVSMIEIKDNGNLVGINSTINIRDNSIALFPNFGVFVGHSSNVNIIKNTFTPISNPNNASVSVFINTKHRTIDPYPAVIVENILIQNNTFNMSTGSPLIQRNGIMFANHYVGTSPAFRNITIGGSGANQANTFAAGLATFISLDPQAGTSTAVIPNTLWAVPNTLTTTAAVSDNFDARFNNYNIGAGLQLPTAMNDAQLMLLENKITHAIDYAPLGFVTVKANHVFVTPISFLPPYTTTPRIRRGTNVIPTDGFTLNINAGTYSQDAGQPPLTAYNMDVRAVDGSVISQGWGMNGVGKTMNMLTDLTISDQIIFTNGNIQTNTNTLILTPAAINPAANPTVNGEKDNSYIIGRAQTNRNVGTGAFNFLGLELQGTTDLGTLNLLRTSGPAGITTAGIFQSIAAKWNINPSVLSARNAIFRWLPAINNGKQPNSLSAWRYDILVSPLWVKETVNFAAAATSPLVESILLNLTKWKEWTITDQPNPLPLNWLSLKAQMNQNGSPEILWTTIEEKNTSHFIIERSKDGRTFEQIGQTQAANTSRANDYRFEDASFKNSAIQNVYYRIRQVDQNQAFTYSGVVKLIQNGDSKLVFDLYPNPNKSSFSISLADGFADSQTTIKVYDTQARLVLQKSYDSQNSEIRFDHNLPAGVYMIICQNNKSRQTKRMIVK